MNTLAPYNNSEFLLDGGEESTTSHSTELGERVGPRLGESHLLTPSGRGGDFTQPRAHSYAQLCTFSTSLIEERASQKHKAESSIKGCMRHETVARSKWRPKSGSHATL